MPEYRIYKVDGDGHLFDVPHVVMCDNDQDAIEKAQRMMFALDLEVWQGERRVTRIKAVQH
jgi:hypothetical protein